MTLLVFMVAGGAGCASRHTRVELNPLEGSRQYGLRFDSAYLSRDAAGDYDILLWADAHLNAAPARQRGDTGVLHPVPQQPLRHLVHIRSRWRPRLGTRPDHPSAANASITWYVLGGADARGVDYLRYEGVGFVTVRSAGNDEANVVLQNFVLEPAGRRGALADPLGRARMVGSARAVRDQRRVEELLEEIARIGP